MKAKNFLPGLAILTFWMLFFYELPGQTFIFRDAFQDAYPAWKFLVQTYAQGFFPLWIPGEYLGLPFLAQTTPTTSYPLIGLVFILPFDLGFSFYVALHYLLAGIFMWQWLRRLALSQAAALIGALAYMESGYLVSMQGMLNYLAPLPWLPLLLLSFDHLLEHPRWRTLIFTAAIFSVPILVGDPLSTGIWLVLLSGWCFLHPAQNRFGFKWPALLAGLILFSGLLLAFQTLPAMELGRWSEKVAGYSYEEITRWSFSPARLREWLFSEFGPFPYSGAFWATRIYLGLVPWLGIGLALKKPRTRITLGLSLLALFFLLLAFGHWTPFYKIFLFLPGMTSFRYPEKFLAPVTFLLCTLAGLGLDRLGETKGLGLLPLLFSGLVTAAAILAHLLGHHAFHTLAVALALLLLFLAQTFRPVFRRWTAPLLILLAWADLHTAHRPLLALAPASLFQGEPRASQILRQLDPGNPASFRIYRDPLIPFPPQKSLRSLPNSILEDIRRFDHETLLPNRAMIFGLVDYLGYTAARPEWIHELAPVSNRRLWSLAGVRYVLWGLEGGPPLGLGELEALQELRRLPDLNLVIYRDREALPRAYAVTGARWARDSIQAKRFLLDTDFSRQVILLGSGEDQPGKVLTPAPALERGEQRAEATIKLDQPGYLVLSDSYFPGWQARVNQTPVRILRANYLVRAVALPAGSSRIEFLYRPWAFRIGLWTSLASLAGFLLGGAISGRSRPER